jgi:hypothetical protein
VAYREVSVPPAGLTPPLDGELTRLLRRLKLGKTVDTLPERLALAKAGKLSHAEFLTLVLADEATRRDASSAQLRARAARLDPQMRLDTFDPDSTARFDREVWSELTSLRLLDTARGALILGPVGVGKTHLATALRRWSGGQEGQVRGVDWAALAWLAAAVTRLDSDTWVRRRMHAASSVATAEVSLFPSRHGNGCVAAWVLETSTRTRLRVWRTPALPVQVACIGGDVAAARAIHPFG